MNRRDFIKSAVPMMGAACLAGAGTAAETPKVAPKGKSEFHSFSRVFQFLGIEKAAELLRECGYDGVEWTVRKKGFVEPSDAKNMLPRAMAAALREGKLGVMDYYQMQNTIADTTMRDSIAKASARQWSAGADDCGGVPGSF